MPICNIIANAGSGKYLNIGDTYTAQNGTNVNVYTGTGSNDQRWFLDSLSTTKDLLVYLNGNRNFALNAKRAGTDWNCTLYQATTETEKTDEYVRLERVGTTGSIYYIKLAKYSNRYLTISSDGNAYYEIERNPSGGKKTVRLQHCRNAVYNSPAYTHEMLLEDWDKGFCRLWTPITEKGNEHEQQLLPHPEK